MNYDPIPKERDFETADIFASAMAAWKKKAAEEREKDFHKEEERQKRWDAEQIERIKSAAADEIAETFSPLLRETNWDHPKMAANKAAIGRVLNWDHKSKRGLMLMGKTGLGKSRSLVELKFRMQRDSALRSRWVWQSEMTRQLNTSMTPDKFMDDMHTASCSPFLFWDDFGKFATIQSRIDLMVSEIEALIDVRHRDQKPTFFSTNVDTQFMASQFGPHRAEPILRRLTEMCEVIHFK